MGTMTIAILAAAWIQVLGQRKGEQGYSDESAASEAARLAIETSKAIQFYMKSEAPK